MPQTIWYLFIGGIILIATASGNDENTTEVDDIQPTDEETKIVIRVSPKVNLPSANTLTSCNLDDNTGCNMTNNERCLPVMDRVNKCTCLPGHGRGRDGVTCVAIKVYRSTLTTAVPFTKDFTDTGSDEYRKMEYQINTVLKAAVKETKLRAIVLDVFVRGLQPSDDGTVVIVDFEVTVSRSYAPDAESVKEDLIEGLKSVSKDGGNSGNKLLGNTEIELHEIGPNNLYVTAPDPCSDPLLNYCDKNAECQKTSRSFTCRCLEGFQDDSPNIMESSGETCTLTCGCKNEGICFYDNNRKTKCRCSSLYFGGKCQIDGKGLFIGVSVVIGCLLLISLLCCCCCLLNIRHQKRSHLPRVHRHQPPGMWDNRNGWKNNRAENNSMIDTWRYYNFNPNSYVASPPPYPTLVKPKPVPSSIRDSKGMELYATPVTIPRPHIVQSHRYYRPGHWYWNAAYT